MLTRDLNHLDLLIVKNIEKIRQIPFDVIVHLPRSGTIPASLLATYIKKPLASVDEYCRRMVNTRKSDINNKALNRILLVDDSIRTAKQMEKNIKKIKMARPDTVIYSLAVYSTKFERPYEPTLCLDEHDEVMYIYPWFMWKSERIEHCAVDMDGVLCRDCTKEEDDDGEKYMNFLRTADLKFHTSFKIGAIVTSRLEKYRLETEAWLGRNGFQYERLIMGPWKSNEERRGKQAAWKGEQFRQLDKMLYVESSLKESPEIAFVSGKPVWCIETQRRYEP